MVRWFLVDNRELPNTSIHLEAQMRRWFWLFLRGRPFLGSNRRWWSGVAEAGFAAALLLAGVVLLVLIITLAVLQPESKWLNDSVEVFSLQLLLAAALIGIGSSWIARLIWHVGVSAERRGAIASRANELELLQELRQRRDDLPTVPRDRFPPRAGRVLGFRLTPSPRNFGGLVLAAFFSIVLLALVTVLVLIVTTEFRPGSIWFGELGQRLGNPQLGKIPNHPWMAAALLVPICLAACWAIFQFFRQLLKLTGIGGTSIEVSGYPLLPGESYQVFLSQTGRVRLKLLEVSLVCQEEVTYNQGTDIRTERATLIEKQLLRRRGISIRRGRPFETEFGLDIPEHSMHSFKSRNNRVQWKIIVTAKAKNWPRLRRSFNVLVFPDGVTAKPTAVPL